MLIVEFAPGSVRVTAANVSVSRHQMYLKSFIIERCRVKTMQPQRTGTVA